MSPQALAVLAELDERWHDLAGMDEMRLERMAIFVRGRGVGRNGPGAAVDQQSGIVRGGEGAHGTMVVHLWKHRCTGSERVNETKWRWYD